MRKVTPKESAIAWGWALEALASSQNVDVSLLHDLIAAAPPELPADLLNSVRERVALICLEHLCGPHRASHSSSSSRRSKLSLDLSESCGEVLKRIMNETPESAVRLGGGELRWDIETFVKHKRASMPKCGLEKLKDSIVDGTHPCAELLGRKSGLRCVWDMSDEEGSEVSVLVSNKGRISAENEDMGVENSDEESSVNAKRMKRDADASFILQSAEDKFVGMEDGRDAYTATKRCWKSGVDAVYEFCAASPCVDKSREEGGLVSKPTTSGAASPHETQDKVSANDSSCNSEQEIRVEVPHSASVGGSKKKSSADEGKVDSEHYPKIATSWVSPPDKPQHASHVNLPRHAAADVSQKKNIGEGTKDPCYLDFVIMEKRDFLSTKSILNRYPSSAEKDRCLMCNGGGQLLICSTSDCPLVYHESCIGSKFISYENADFLCPFCVYSLHLTQYLEAEKEASRLRKDLHSFFCLLGSRSRTGHFREIQRTLRKS